MSHLSPSDLTGSWRMVRTEVPPPFDPASEFYHFSPDGFHYWEYPLEPNPRLLRFRYEIIESGVRLTVRNGEYPRDLPLRLEGDLLVMTGTHGYSSWLQRIPTSERPAFLKRFFEPPE